MFEDQAIFVKILSNFTSIPVLCFVSFLFGSLIKDSQETEGKSTLLGFIGSPFTLAAYAVEGKAEKNCFQVTALTPKTPTLVDTRKKGGFLKTFPWGTRTDHTWACERR
jgi:hypothetical protein